MGSASGIDAHSAFLDVVLFNVTLCFNPRAFSLELHSTLEHGPRQCVCSCWQTVEVTRALGSTRRDVCKGFFLAA